ncbi:MAG TPA: thiol reductase thioredoxin [Alphaproteobacteria bacterium]|nr:thiol reductase thioredoxin [Alphaproteobacteria bacterium]
MSEIREVTDASFDEEVLGSDTPVLVDFWGDHCPGCLQIAPILDAIARERAGELKVVKVHAVENAATSARFGIRSMPTVLLFAGGEVRGQLVGARPKNAFLDLIAQVV